MSQITAVRHNILFTVVTENTKLISAWLLI